MNGETHHHGPSSRLINWCKPWASVLAAFFLSSATILSVCSLRTHHHLSCDEVYWVGSAYYYHLAFHERDFSNPHWRLLPGRENPPAGKFLIGAALDLFGADVTTPDLLGSFYLMFAQTEGAWGTGADFEKRAAVATLVNPAAAEAVLHHRIFPFGENVLAISRGLMAVLAMITAGAIYIIGRRCGESAGGLFAAVAFGLHPVAVASYYYAVIDMVALCFSTLAVAGYVAVVKQVWKPARHPRLVQVALAIFIGLMLAFACGTKMNSLIVLLLGGVTAGFHALRWRRTGNLDDHRSMILLGTAFLMAGAVFIAINPTLYSDLSGGLFALIHEHQLTAKIQACFIGGALTTIPSRIIPLAQLVSGYSCIFVIVLGAVAVQSYLCWRRGSLFILVIGWWLIAYVLLLLWLPFAWERYALPLVAPTLLIIGKTFADLIALLRSRKAA